MFPFFPGISVPNKIHYDEEENKRVYEATQQQRKLERDYSRELVQEQFNNKLFVQNKEVKIKEIPINNSYTVNRKLVNSKLYRDKFDKLPVNKEVTNTLYTESKKILENRNVILTI